MLNWWRHNLSLSFVLLIGVMTGYVVLTAAPLLTARPILILGLFAVMVYFLVMVISPEKALMVLLLSRALLDRILESTRIDIAGQNMGLGAGINLAAIILTLVFWFRASGTVFPKNLLRIWCVFLGMTFFSVFYTPDPGRALRLWFNFITYFCMLMLPFFLVDTQDKKHLWWNVLLGSLILPVVFADIDWLRTGQASLNGGARVDGTFAHPNILAFYLGLGIILVVYALLRKDWKWLFGGRGLFKLLAVNMLFLLLMTKTRNAWIAFWFTFFLYGCRHDRRLAVALFVLPPLALLIPSVLERAQELFRPDYFSLYGGENSWVWRLELWQSSLPWIFRNPFMGYGLCSFVPLSVNFFKSFAGVGAHNVFIELLFETGVIGLMAYLGIFGVILKRLFESTADHESEGNGRARTLAAVYIISYLVINMADNLLYYLSFNWYFWFFAGMLLVEHCKFSVRASS
jgi:O-antigen ligase